MQIKEWKEIPRDARPKVRYWVPGSAMDKADLKEELKALKDRGFGGVELVTLFNLPDNIAKGEDGWGTRHWNQILKEVNAVAEELDLSMDVANGPGWPIAMPTISSLEDPAVLCELTYGITKVEGRIYQGPLPERKSIREEGRPVLVHVMAYLSCEEKILLQDSYQDLTGQMKENEGQAYLNCILPEPEPGCQWLIFAFYRQPAGQKAGSTQDYVIDHLSAEGVRACEEYWDTVMKDENFGAMESIFCDSMEYSVMMDWTPAFPEEFERRRGYSILPYLPVVGMEELFPVTDIPGFHFADKKISDIINNDYLETLTQCYCEYHLAGMEKMAEKYGKTIRYQVAYNKPFEGERSALYVEIPENEALGRPAVDFQKTMAAAAHLGRKKRYSFECAAEFGNAYGQNYEDLFWWVKRSLMAGMNAQVLHGASYSGAYQGKYSVDGYMEGVTWPGYEGFGKGVSNYWNRTLSIRDARGAMDAAARLNALFQKQAKVDCAIYRQSYRNDGLGSEFCFYPDDGCLSNCGYSYETLSPFLLNLPNCKVTDGVLDCEGTGYRCLIIPEQQYVSLDCLERLETLLQDGLKVIWIGKEPVCAYYYREWNTEEAKQHWKSTLERVWEKENLIHVGSHNQVLDALKRLHILPRLQAFADKDLMTAVRRDEEAGICYYAVYGNNRVKYTPETPNTDECLVSAIFQKGTTKSSYERPGKKSQSLVKLSLEGTGQVYHCDYWSGTVSALDFQEIDGRMTGYITLEEDELVLLAMDTKQMPEKKGELLCRIKRLIPGAVQLHTLELSEFLPDTPQEKSFLRSHFSKERMEYSLKALRPIRELAPNLAFFAGKCFYHGTITLEKKEIDRQYLLCLGHVQDTFFVTVNGRPAPYPDQVHKQTDITGLLQEGENTLCVEVTTNLYNRLLKDNPDLGVPFPVPYVEKDYGIWESGEEVCALYVVEKEKMPCR